MIKFLNKVTFLIFGIFFTAPFVNGQANNWVTFNDSVIKYATAYASNYCTDLSSSRTFSKRQIKQDIQLIKMVNKLYNDIGTLQELEQLKKQCKKCSDEAFIVDTLMPAYLHRTSEGNLSFIFNASEINDTLVEKRILLITNSKTGCNSKNNCCLYYFDIMYVKNYLLKYIQFPFLYSPGTAQAVVGLKYNYYLPPTSE